MTLQKSAEDSEREEIARIIGGHIDAPVSSRLAIARSLQGNGFRRSEVPEPSVEGPAFIAIMPPSPETSKRWYSMYCLVCGVEEMMADTADDPRLLDRRDEHNRERHAEPQGEPSDAQEAVRRLKESGVGAFMILAAVTKVYDMETKS